MGIIKEMRGVLELTEREKDIRDYILNHPEQVEKLSSRELASVTFTSASSVTRFCQKLGCEGYQEFKLRFLSDLKAGNFNEEDESKSITMSPKDNVASVIKKIVDTQKKALDYNAKEIPLEQMVRISQMFYEAEYIDIYAHDVNVAIAEYACNQFFYCGKIANVYRSTKTQELLALMKKRDHLAILISRTGENSRLIEIGKTLKKNKITTIVLTVNKTCSIAKVGDEVVAVANERYVEDLGTVIFSTSIKFVFDILFAMTFSKKYEENMKLNREYEKVGRSSLWALINDV